MKNKYPTITIRVDQEVKTLIERQAKKQDVTVSELLRQFIETGLHNV
jgi:antitoxin component of RelBE/YafQ-DinJ toxin-antitoxin module